MGGYKITGGSATPAGAARGGGGGGGGRRGGGGGGGAGALSTWRYEVGLSRATVAIDDRADARTAVGLSAAFWRERQAMLSYLVYGLPTLMREVTTQRDEFRRLVAELGSPGTAAEARSLTQGAAAFAHYYSVFTQVKGTAAAPPARGGTAAAPPAPGAAP